MGYSGLKSKNLFPSPIVRETSQTRWALSSLALSFSSARAPDEAGSAFGPRENDNTYSRFAQTIFAKNLRGPPTAAIPPARLLLGLRGDPVAPSCATGEQRPIRESPSVPRDPPPKWAFGRTPVRRRAMPAPAGGSGCANAIDSAPTPPSGFSALGFLAAAQYLSHDGLRALSVPIELEPGSKSLF